MRLRLLRNYFFGHCLLISLIKSLHFWDKYFHSIVICFLSFVFTTNENIYGRSLLQVYKAIRFDIARTQNLLFEELVGQFDENFTEFKKTL